MPQFSTSCGLTVTAESDAAAAAVEAFAHDLVDLTPGMDAIPTLAETYQETAMIQACAAVYFLYAQETAGLAQAKTYLHRAELQAPACTSQETGFIRALGYLHARQFETALELLETHTSQWPGDLMAAKVAEFLYYCIGQHHSGPRFLAHMKRLESHQSQFAGYWAMRSFATELCGDYAIAEREAGQSLSLNPDQPWAHHTLAHVQSRQGRSDEISTMASLLPVWRKANRGIHSHNAWHLALLYLDQLDLNRVRQLIQEDLWGITPDTIFEQLDTIALLWRLDLCGQPATEALWKEVARHVKPHAGQCFIPFIDGHLTYCLARAGETEAAQDAVASARRRSSSEDAEARRVWAPVGADFVAACAAFGQNNQSEAVDLLKPIMGKLTCVGGSDAQVDLFRLAYIAGLKARQANHEAQTAWRQFYPGKNITSFETSILG